MEWKYVAALKNPNAVQEFLDKQKINLPEEVVAFIVQHNAGRPKPNRFNTEAHKECVFDGVFSYNEDDEENIYSIYTGELREDLRQKGMFPFAIEPGGDLICVNLKKKNQIVLLRLETGECEFIAVNINEMLDKMF